MTLLDRHILPEERRPRLKRALISGHTLRFMECHNPLSALVASETTVENTARETVRFDGLWVSGFSIATSRALPDIELGRLEKRLETVEEIASATALPLIVDADTGGEPAAFRHLCTRLEALGVSAVVVEDKVFPKRSSLAANASHSLEDPAAFVAKITDAKRTLRSADFMIIARTEALIAGAGIEEAIRRAGYYLQSEADAILIHSKMPSGEDVLEFAGRFKALCASLGMEKPLFAIPTAYPHVTEDELKQAGVTGVIYGNHQIRAAYAAMTSVCKIILRHGRSLEAHSHIASVDDIFSTLSV